MLHPMFISSRHSFYEAQAEPSKGGSERLIDVPGLFAQIAKAEEQHVCLARQTAVQSLMNGIVYTMYHLAQEIFAVESG